MLNDSASQWEWFPVIVNTKAVNMRKFLMLLIYLIAVIF